MLVLNDLTLREFRRSDIPEVLRAFNDFDLASLAQPGAPQPTTAAVLEGRFRAGVGAVSSGGVDDIEFVVTRTTDASSAPLGVAGLYGINWAHGHAEIGVVISSSSGRGRGLGIDSFVALATYAFHDLRLNRVYSGIKAGNEHALGALRRVGLSPEGTLRQARFRGGQFEDLVIAGMLAQDWDPNLLEWRHMRL